MRISSVLFILASTIFVIVAADFDSFAKKHGKKYANEIEKKKREKKYVENCKKIDDLNTRARKQKSAVEFKENKFADLDADEFADIYLGVISEDSPKHRSLQQATKMGITKDSIIEPDPFTGRIITKTATKTTTTRTTTKKTTKTTTTKTTTTKTTTTKTTTTKTTTTKTTTTKTTTTKSTTKTTTKTTTRPSTSSNSNSSGFDWTTQTGIVAPVKDQKTCGSCWAFAATGVLESFYARKPNPLTLFSEQLLVDCNTYVWGYPGGCSGNFLFAPFDFFKANGTEKSVDYPYVAQNLSCKYNPLKVVLKINSYGYTMDESRYADILVTYGPFALQINGYPLQWYSSGILTLSTCSNSLINHAVILVGYGTENGVNYWRIKNSWGTSWGESGFVRVKRGENACAIARGNAYYIIS